MDETDSGLDIDALRTVAEGVNALMTPEMGIVLITHYQRLLNYIKPEFVHILYQGRIIRVRRRELAPSSKRRATTGSRRRSTRRRRCRRRHANSPVTGRSQNS